MIVTYTDNDKRLHVVFDDERTAPPEIYSIWLVNGSRVVCAQAGESSAATWRRVLQTVVATRLTTAASLRHFPYFATIFVDVQPTEQHRNSITKDRLSAKLYELADPAYNKDANSRVEALIALSKLHGLNQPEIFIIPSLEQLNEEIALHQGQK